jgi:hypothetical protein
MADDSLDLKISNSINSASPLDEDDKDDKLGYRRRAARICTINVRPTKDNKFYKVIVPYNFDKKTYFIKRSEIEFWENKHYLIDKLDKFCSMPIFDIEKQYQAVGYQKFLMYLPVVIICIILLYVVMIITVLFSFNSILLYTLYSWIRKGFNKLQMFKFILLEKWKIKEMNKLLEKENESEFCIDNKLQWKLGQSGYWLEIQKLI